MLQSEPRDSQELSMYKLQLQDDEDDHRVWHDVKGPDGKILVFQKEEEARKKLQELFPVLYGLEKYQAGPKRTRVIRIYGVDEDEEDE
jgi:hypothetical protein